MSSLGIPVTIIVGLFAAIISAAIALRSLAQQKRLSYLQSILQVPANRVRLQSLLSSVRYLSAFERLFPDGYITEESIEGLGTKTTDHYDILTLTIYTSDRLFSIRNKRVKYGDQMEKYEEYLNNSGWPESWKTSDDPVLFFKDFVRRTEKDGTSAGRCIEYFSRYVKRFVFWSLLEPQFDMIFSVAPRIRRKIESIIISSLDAEKATNWMGIEKQIHMFYQGKKW